jgi:hypothetical protein
MIRDNDDEQTPKYRFPFKTPKDRLPFRAITKGQTTCIPTVKSPEPLTRNPSVMRSTSPVTAFYEHHKNLSMLLPWPNFLAISLGDDVISYINLGLEKSPQVLQDSSHENDVVSLLIEVY